MLLKFNRIKEVNNLVKKHHYSHRPIPEGLAVLSVSYHEEGGGLFGNEGPAKAGVLFCIPPTRWSEPVLELLRMVRTDDYKGPSLSSLVSQGIKKLRRDRERDLVVSFADPSFDHHGGIYQACSWNYHGIRAGGIDGFQIGNRFVPRRTCFNLYGTSSLEGLMRIFEGRSSKITPHHDPGKHLYWKSLDKNGEKKTARLGLLKSPYPKPNQGMVSDVHNPS